MFHDVVEDNTARLQGTPICSTYKVRWRKVFMNRKKALIYIAAVLLLVLATVFSAVKLISGETQMGSI